MNKYEKIIDDAIDWSCPIRVWMSKKGLILLFSPHNEKKFIEAVKKTALAVKKDKAINTFNYPDQGDFYLMPYLRNEYVEKIINLKKTLFKKKICKRCGNEFVISKERQIICTYCRELKKIEIFKNYYLKHKSEILAKKKEKKNETKTM